MFTLYSDVQEKRVAEAQTTAHALDANTAMLTQLRELLVRVQSRCPLHDLGAPTTRVFPRVFQFRSRYGLTDPSNAVLQQLIFFK